VRSAALEASNRRKIQESLKQQSTKSSSHRLHWLPYAGVGLASAGGLLAFTQTGREFFDKYLYDGPIKMVHEFLSESVSEFTDPISQNLLPDFPAEFNFAGRKPPRTLVLDFEDTLCHLEWNRKAGWTAAKRPDLDMFLGRLASYYEIVIFTNGNFNFLEPYVEAIDPFRLITHKLYRESTLYENGEHIKDLSKLNRDLSRVVVVDDQPLKKQPENGIIIKPFEDPYTRDTELLDLLPFLEDLAKRDVPDVRQEIAKFEGKYIPAEFKKIHAERQRKIEEKKAGTLAGFIRPKSSPSQQIPTPAAAPQQDFQGLTPKDQADKLMVATENDSKASSSIWGSFLRK